MRPMAMAETRAPSASAPGPLLRVAGLSRYFDVSPPFLDRVLGGAGRQILKAVDGVSFDVPRGETLSLVGESGCGKSTVARCVVGLYRPTRGRIEFDGVDIATLKGSALHRSYRSRIQMVFQDPYASLNPRWRVSSIIAEPIVVHRLAADRGAMQRRIDELLRHVGL